MSSPVTGAEWEGARIADLEAVIGAEVTQLPHVLRLLLENIIRTAEPELAHAAAQQFRSWLVDGTSESEIPFLPQRLLMHDTTSTPALVDVAAMRDVLASYAVDPMKLNPVLPIQISIDHSLAVEAYGVPDAPVRNVRHELRRNSERYAFLKWSSASLTGVHVNPPGTGIMHTINLEQLATVVTTEQRNGEPWVIPDQMLGTDSHTPMVNALGVLGWGIGGLEAETVMFGFPTMLRIPDVVGVRLSGRLKAGVLATDLALVITHVLRETGVTGEFVEFFGSGVSTLTVGDRGVIANMAPEYGATTGFFPIDERTLDYLTMTGRPSEKVGLVERYARRNHLWFDVDAAPRFTRTVEINLDDVQSHVAGPRRPQDLLPLSGTRDALLAERGPQSASDDTSIPRFAVALAAITSCTNTTDPRLLVTAGLLARRARALGLMVPSFVKTSLSPGSPAAASYLRRAGLLDDLNALGFDIVGFGCATCIGNPGPLTEVVAAARQDGRSVPVAILSGNRNFPGRVHPDIELSFIMSPPLVIAMALAGDATTDLSRDPIQVDASGNPVMLTDVWPTEAEVDAAVESAVRSADFLHDFTVASANPLWKTLVAPDSALFPWDEASTILRPPPFASPNAGTQLGVYAARPLLVLGDDITTDHISPASAIPADSFVADFLVGRGEQRDDLNVFASRRGNWEVMVRGAFYNRSVRSTISPLAPTGHGTHVPSGDTMPLFELAARYQDEGVPLVIVAGARYGMGSSRDWAAKAQRLLGVRAVIARSFERIHRTNLIGMGILPVTIPSTDTAHFAALAADDVIEVGATADSLHPRGPIPVAIRSANGEINRFALEAAVETQVEVELLRSGGVIPSILSRFLDAEHAGVSR